MVVNNNVKLEYVLINNIVADELIKAFFINKFNKFKNLIRLKLLDE